MLAALLACGCTFDHETPLTTGETVVGYDVVRTKAAVAFPVDRSFISTAYTLGRGKTWDSDAAYAAIDFGPETVSYNPTDKYWKTASDHYWPTDGSSLTFFSYAPATLHGMTNSDSDPVMGISTGGVTVSGWDVTAANMKDKEIMVADIAKDKVRNESYAEFYGVPTCFRHKLSKVKFTVSRSSYAEEDAIVRIKAISVRNIYVKGDYSRGGYLDDSWSSAAYKRTDMPLYQSSELDGDLVEKDKDLAFGGYIVMPQSLLSKSDGHPMLVVNYTLDGVARTGECYFDENLRQENWEMGKETTYQIYLGVGQYPIMFDGTVADWDSVENVVNIGN